MARYSSFERRRAKLADAGFIRANEYRKYTKAGADRLRRLEEKYQRLRSYFKKGEYQIYQSRSKQRIDSLRHIQPREIQRWKLPYLILHTGRRQLADKRVVPNVIQKITKDKKGGFTVQTDGPTLRFPKITARQIATRTEQAIAQLTSMMGPRSRVRLRLGLSVTHGAFSASTIGDYIRYFVETYLDEDSSGDDFFEGFEIIDL